MALGCRIWDPDGSECFIPGQHWSEESGSLVNKGPVCNQKKYQRADIETKQRTTGQKSEIAQLSRGSEA